MLKSLTVLKACVGLDPITHQALRARVTNNINISDVLSGLVKNGFLVKHFTEPRTYTMTDKALDRVRGAGA